VKTLALGEGLAVPRRERLGPYPRFRLSKFDG